MIGRNGKGSFGSTPSSKFVLAGNPVFTEAGGFLHEHTYLTLGVDARTWWGEF